MAIDVDLKAARKLISLRDTASKRGLDCDISLISLINIYKAKRCFFTGVKLSVEEITLDRVDNSKGYVKGNVVACSDSFNGKKGSLTLEEIEILYKKTRRFSEKS